MDIYRPQPSEMRRYYFHIKIEGGHHVDAEGQWHAGDVGALAHAERVASELAGEYIGRVIVTGEEGHQIGEVAIPPSSPSNEF
jgi:hypothetical protein